MNKELYFIVNSFIRKLVTTLLKLSGIKVVCSSDIHINVVSNFHVRRKTLIIHGRRIFIDTIGTFGFSRLVA